ncbi:hypothetical protein TNIN_445551 [Trichonephila inaurata madagascariensis]|uniref:Uncharacterized protein n=1 Tax=Trichonephila inaurata madagascariensis TaxID=2747483 RepID=A0A8X7BVE0_9ARAC|nr:hypothetical protein TNIN_445551 [Trichonephila inaurata madagascariensis]
MAVKQSTISTRMTSRCKHHGAEELYGRDGYIRAKPTKSSLRTIEPLSPRVLQPEDQYRDHIELFLSTRMARNITKWLDNLVAITPNPNNGTRGSLHPLLRNPMRPLQDEEEPQPPSKGVAKTHEPGAAHCPCQWVILFNVSTS